MYLKILFVITIVNNILVGFCQREKSLLNERGSNSHPDDVNYCRISYRDLIATAESTSNRLLQGVCNPRELNTRFTTLETQIIDQFNILKTMILNIEDKLRDQDEKIKGQHRKIHRGLTAFRRKNPGELKKKSNGMNRKQEAGGLKEEEDDNSVYDYYDDEEESLDDEEFEEDTPSPRIAELTKYNSTIQIENDKRAFTYYWTIKDIPYRMKNWGWRRSLRSNSFYIFKYGYRMYMRIYPNQNGKNIYIHAGLTKGAYDAALDWPFKLKLRIEIIDHDIPGDDMYSRIWDPTQLCSGWNWRRPDSAGDNYECVGLGFAHETIYIKHYLHNNAITVKLTVFLD